MSADYLLGRSLSRDGTVIEAGELPDASEAREDLKGSVAAKLQKKLLVNTTSVLFDLLGRTNNREAASWAGAYLGGALYQLFRQLYRAAGGNEGYFSTDSLGFDLDIVASDMALSRLRFARALDAYRGAYPPVDAQALAEEYQALSQSLAQVLHEADERVRKLEG